MHSLLDASTMSIIWDVRESVRVLRTSRSVSKFYGPNALSFPLTSTGAGHALIISKEMPWAVEVGPKSRALTATDILYGIYELLQKDLDDVAWGLADDATRERIERAWKRRTSTSSNPDVAYGKPKNVDWLGKQYMFRGLHRDDRYAKERLRPGDGLVKETWIVTFGRP